MLVVANLMFGPTGTIRDVLDVKGAGEMETWFLVGRQI